MDRISALTLTSDELGRLFGDLLVRLQPAKGQTLGRSVIDLCTLAAVAQALTFAARVGHMELAAAVAAPAASAAGTSRMRSHTLS